MAKKKPNRTDQRYEVKLDMGKDASGKRIRKSFYSTISMADAEKKKNNWLTEFRAKQLIGAEEYQDIEFDKWALHWLITYKEGKVKENTYTETYERPVKKILIPYFKKIYLNHIKPSDVEHFFKVQAEHYSESTLHKLKLCLNGIFDTAIENCFAKINPAKKAKFTANTVSKEKRSYTEAEYNKIISFAKEHLNDIPDSLLIWVELECGLRPEELFGLDYSDFDLDNCTLHIQRAVVSVRGIPTLGDVKNKRSNRFIPFSSALRDALLTYPRQGILTGSLLDSSKWSGRRYRRWFEKFRAEHPDVEIYTPHELRHTRGTILYRKTGDIYAVSRFLGHSSVKITEQIYVHVGVDDLRKSLQIN